MGIQTGRRAACKTSFIFICIFLTLSSQPGFLLAAESSDLIAARKSAAHLFENKCSSCHESPDSPDLPEQQVFGPGWLPCKNVEQVGDDQVCKDSKKDHNSLIDKVMKAVRWAPGVHKMPPPKNPDKSEKYNKHRGQLLAADIAILQDWSDEETGADRVCQVLAEAPQPNPEHPVVTDAEAADIMGNSCAGCHGKVGSFTSRETKGAIGIALAGVLALAANKGVTWVKNRFNPGAEKVVAPLSQVTPTKPPPAGFWRSCLRWFGQMAWKPINGAIKTATFAANHPLATAGFLDAMFLGTGQGTKYGHSEGKFTHKSKTFQDGDYLYPAAVAKGDLSLSRFHQSIVSATMPIDLPAPLVTAISPIVRYPSDQDRDRLGAWVAYLQETKLPKGCAVHQVAETTTYGKAAKRCNDMGMRLPTAEQLEKLAKQDIGKSLHGAECVWSSGFSNDPNAPRQAYQVGKGLVPVTTSAKCQMVCYR